MLKTFFLFAITPAIPVQAFRLEASTYQKKLPAHILKRDEIKLSNTPINLEYQAGIKEIHRSQDLSIIQCKTQD